jgi:hypothetical protein
MCVLASGRARRSVTSFCARRMSLNADQLLTLRGLRRALHVDHRV